MYKMQSHDTFQFKDEHGKIINHRLMERQEQLDSFIFVPAESCVLELGARYGTVSCLINKSLSDPTAHVAVEPDHRVIDALKDNRDRYGSKFHIFNGAVSKEALSYNPSGYSGTTQTGKNNIKTLSLQQLEAEYNLQFDTLVADCEGCIEQFVKENDMTQFKLIILEKDNCADCNYEYVESVLHKKDFISIKAQHNIVWRNVYVRTHKFGFDIVRAKVSHGHLGLFGQLGYEVNGITRVQSGGFTISAHAPSEIVLNTHRTFEICGHYSKTAKNPSELTFICDNQTIGKLDSANTNTNSLKLDPGEHCLKIISNKLNWAHSIWLLKEISTERS